MSRCSNWTNSPANSLGTGWRRMRAKASESGSTMPPENTMCSASHLARVWPRATLQGLIKGSYDCRR